MAFDGITIACIVSQLKEQLVGGRIYKIAQPEKDELLLTIKTVNGQKRLLLSADPSLPLVYLTEENKLSPMTAPNFCMLLRKHLQNAKILDISQPGLERIVQFKLEHLDELGDLCTKVLIIEIMGKHSNIIFCDDKNTIIDSIKHISGLVSSVREVLPQREYFIPETMDKKNPLATNEEEFVLAMMQKSQALFKAIYTSYTGISPLVAQEVCVRAGLDADLPTNTLERDSLLSVYKEFDRITDKIKENEYQPVLIYENGKVAEYGVFEFLSYPKNTQVAVNDISELLTRFYEEKNKSVRIRQRSADLRKIVQTALERSVKKLDLQQKQLEDTKDREKYRIYGELLHTYGYEAKPQDTEITVLNYYSNESLTIPLNPQLSANENAQKYFDKYGKMKRTDEAMQKYIAESTQEVEYLRSIQTYLDIAAGEEDLLQIHEELVQNGFIRKTGGKNKPKRVQSRPFCYTTNDGYVFYVGKNNLQNEELTFKVASGNDWWFHAKGIPGSHVIVKCVDAQQDSNKLPDHVFEIAASLAAHYSSAGDQEKVEVDYTQKKNIKKTPGAKPGFVIYHTNYSMFAYTDISGLDQK